MRAAGQVFAISKNKKGTKFAPFFIAKEIWIGIKMQV
jgi:hypothetical protein